MKQCPEACAKIRCFNDTLFELIQDFLNGGGEVKYEDCFIQAAAILEKG
jgi:hypothetical protein